MQEMQETWVPSLSWEDPLEEEMATHSSIFAWKIPWTEEPGSLQSIGSQSQTCLATVHEDFIWLFILIGRLGSSSKLIQAVNKIHFLFPVDQDTLSNQRLPALLVIKSLYLQGHK